MGRKQPEPFTLKNIPVDQGFQLHQLMSHVDHLDQAGAQEVVLVRSRLSWLHITSRNCRVSAPTIPDPASLIQQIPAVYQYNQIPNRCSGRTIVEFHAKFIDGHSGNRHSVLAAVTCFGHLNSPYRVTHCLTLPRCPKTSSSVISNPAMLSASRTIDILVLPIWAAWISRSGLTRCGTVIWNGFSSDFFVSAPAYHPPIMNSSFHDCVFGKRPKIDISVQVLRIRR